MDNKPITSELEAWLAFLSFDEPERILELITKYPEFRAMYQNIYEMCLNMEKVMSLFSKELIEMDHNTVLYMIDEMQLELDQKKGELEQTQGELEQTQGELTQTQGELALAKGMLNEQRQRIQQLEAQLAALQSGAREKE